MNLRSLLREPLVAFFALAAVIFALHAARAREPERIVLDRAEVRRVQTARLGRVPTRDEMEVALRRAAEDEALVREARRLGLASEDTIVRRRLAQKMELLAEDLAALESPTEAEVQAYLSTHADRYREPERRDVQHVFMGEDRGASEALRRRLVEGADPATLGLPFPLGRRFDARTEAGLSRVLTATVARLAFEVRPQAWVGPVRSAYGWHLLRVDAVRPQGEVALEGVRRAVLRDLERARREAARAEVRRTAAAKYTVEVIE